MTVEKRMLLNVINSKKYCHKSVLASAILFAKNCYWYWQQFSPTIESAGVFSVFRA